MLYMGQVFVHGEKDVISTPRMMGVSIGLRIKMHRRELISLKFLM